jgi:hypothetical protein
MVDPGVAVPSDGMRWTALTGLAFCIACSDGRTPSGPPVVVVPRDAGSSATRDAGASAIDSGVEPGRDGGTTPPRDGGTTDPRDGGTLPMGQCPPGALCLADTNGDQMGDHCVFLCQTTDSCPRNDLGCFTCANLGGANYCAPNANPPNLDECRFPSDGNPPVLLCLEGDCPTGQVCLRLDPNAPAGTPGWCSPACTP